MNWNVFCENIREIFDLDENTKDGDIQYKFDEKSLAIEYNIRENKTVRYTYTKRKFSKDYKSEQEGNDLCISNEKYYEIPISSDNNTNRLVYNINIRKEYCDNENNLKYKIGTPSKQFWLKIVELKIRTYIPMPIRRLYINLDELKFNDGIEEKDIFELFHLLYREYITLQIYSIYPYGNEEFSKLADSFIFDINYNTDIGIRQTHEIDDIHERRRSNRFRRCSMMTISAPKKIYKKELVEQYNMASISEEPFIKYLCYYHILEHFYEAVYKEELVKIVKDKLTLPSFSIKKEKEIIKLIDVIKEKVKYEREGFDGDELEALELVIKKYVKIEDIKDEIQNINSELVEYYNSKEVKFSNGIPVNFKDIDNVYKNIAKRIYFTRNALVHYKSNNFSERKMGLYRPFNDREELLKEIPLIRILAEKVIIADADII